MPRGDGTGPMGRGPGTGRGAGRCGGGPGQGRRRSFWDLFRRSRTIPTVPADPEAVDHRLVRAMVETSQCTGCGVCVDTCRYDAIRLEAQVAVVDPNRCAGCGACVDLCPKNAITLKKR